MDRVVRIRKELQEVERTRHLQRSNRVRGETPTLALIGYTNAGKSTFFNRLTGAGVLSQDMLFATLDPTMRGLCLASGRRAVIADTVGFISQLPTELVEAFKSTLEEVVQADLLLHVHDASSPMIAEEADDVRAILADLGLDEDEQRSRIIHILNKSDRLADADDRQSLLNLFPGAVFTSALTGKGVDDALAAIDARLSAGALDCTLALDRAMARRVPGCMRMARSRPRPIMRMAHRPCRFRLIRRTGRGSAPAGRSLPAGDVFPISK